MTIRVNDSLDASHITHIVHEIDRLIEEMTTLRHQLTVLQAGNPNSSVREADYFGMWAEREDMRGLSSREWLEQLRSRQWSRQ
jgi:ribosomal protein L29